MHVAVDKEIINIYPNIKVFSFVADPIQEEKNYPNDLPTDLTLPDNISTIPVISQWRDIYRCMSIKPTKHYSSIEALLKRYKKGRWKTGNQFIDLYNYFSINYLAPIGVYDFTKLQALRLRFAFENDIYQPLNSVSTLPIDKSKIVYACSNRIVCWAINHRDSKEFCVTDETSKYLIVSEGFTVEQADCAFRAITNFHNFYKSIQGQVSEIMTHKVISKENDI